MTYLFRNFQVEVFEIKNNAAGAVNAFYPLSPLGMNADADYL